MKMKKVLFVSALAVLALASCQKDYYCSCITPDGFEVANTTIRDTKGSAEDKCSGLAVPYETGTVCSIVE